MCGDCWNAAMGAPAAAVAARFAWIGYRDRIPFLNRRADRVEVAAEADGPTRCQARDGTDRDVVVEAPAPELTPAPELVDAGGPPSP